MAYLIGGRHGLPADRLGKRGYWVAAAVGPGVHLVSRPRAACGWSPQVNLAGRQPLPTPAESAERSRDTLSPCRPRCFARPVAFRLFIIIIVAAPQPLCPFVHPAPSPAPPFVHYVWQPYTW